MKENAKSDDALTRVVEQLEEDIVFGRLRPRERLVEEDLVGRFGVKRHVVRQALIQLEQVGIVIRQRGKGARVCEFTPTEVAQLYAVRELLESEAARMIPLPAEKGLIRALTAIHKSHGKAVAAGELRAIYRSNIRYHEILFEACGNPYLVEAIGQLAMKANLIRFYVGRDPSMFAGSRDEHGEIIEALKAGDREKLVKICVDHLRPSPKAYIEAYRALFGEG
ncbi:MAG: GntR family transcriptional regulator [Rhodospirillales bacterium]|nr:GntR family transcriptional regulator [Rhodospirillales bacterium]